MEAVVLVSGVDNYQFTRPRRSDPRTGRFIRFLQPGTYNLVVAAEGYKPRTFRVEVGNSLSEVTLAMRTIWAPSSASPPGL